MIGDALKIVIPVALVAAGVSTYLSRQNEMRAAAAQQAQAPRSGQAAVPQKASMTSSFNRAELSPDSAGHYNTEVELNGRRINVLVDTGASVLALTAEDADMAGIRPQPSEFTVKMQTANGESRGAYVRVREVRLGNLRVYDVDAVVMQRGASRKSLLGMSFLKKLSGFEVAQGRLILRQ